MYNSVKEMLVGGLVVGNELNLQILENIAQVYRIIC